VSLLRTMCMDAPRRLLITRLGGVGAAMQALAVLPESEEVQMDALTVLRDLTGDVKCVPYVGSVHGAEAIGDVRTPPPMHADHARRDVRVVTIHAVFAWARCRWKMPSSRSEPTSSTNAAPERFASWLQYVPRPSHVFSFAPAHALASPRGTPACVCVPDDARPIEARRRPTAGYGAGARPVIQWTSAQHRPLSRRPTVPQ